MEFVFPIPKWLRGRLLNYKRLYAFPTIPEENPFILDSGAFGLSKSGQRMNVAYLENLYQYYKQYPGWHVAPDVFLNPFQTMKNFEKWVKKYPDCQVWPVIQFAYKKVEWAIIKYQLDFYADFFDRLEVIFLSNPSLRFGNYLFDIFQIIKDYCEVAWLHNLGAGWDIEDITGYSKMPGLDSIDSISYYKNLSYDRKYVSKEEATLKNVNQILECLKKANSTA